VQYPGVADSIRSDLWSMKQLIYYTGLVPPGLFLDRILEVAQRELLQECDYVNEATATRRFKRLMAPYPEFAVPAVVQSLSSQRVLTTEWMEGLSIDRAAKGTMTSAERDRVGSRLLWLSLTELFTFRFMQTDPNWSNFLYAPRTRPATGSVITSAIPGSVASPWRSTRPGLTLPSTAVVASTASSLAPSCSPSSPETSEWETDDSRFASWIRRAARGGRVETSETDEERHASRAERAELGESASGWETDDDRYPGWLLDADRLCKSSRALLAPDGADAVAPNAVAAMVTVGAAASAAARPPSACTPSPRGLLRRT